jgi:formylglycine-generating enzyme required for sulfatase activity
VESHLSTPVRILALVLAGALWACSPVTSAREEALLDLEQLAYIPAGSVRLPPYFARSEVCEIAEPLLVDRYEVPRGRWLAYQRRLGDDVDPGLRERASTWSEDSWSWPATWMTLFEARAFARARGMRLFTAREWLFVAAGTRGLAYPWGQTRGSLVANTVELGLSRPLPVGTFELGVTAFSTYEMSGNVWEWVEEPIETELPREADHSQLAWVMGGSFATALQPLYEVDKEGRLTFQSLTLDPRSRGDDIGLRCAVSARTYLAAHADDFGGDEATRDRLVAVGRRFGRDAMPLLEELARGSPSARALRWMLEGASQ